MRCISGLLAISLTVGLRAQALDTYVFTFDVNHQKQGLNEVILSENAAWLVLQHRMKPSDASVLGLIDKDTADHLNHFGGIQASLFAPQQKHSLQKGLVVLEGLDTGAVSYIPHISTGFKTGDLLASPAEVQIGLGTGHRLCGFHADDDIAKHGASQAARECFYENTIFEDKTAINEDLLAHISDVESWVETTSSVAALRVSFKPGTASGSVLTFLKSLVLDLSKTASEGKQEATLVISPHLHEHGGTDSILKPRENVKEAFLSKSLSSSAEGQGPHIGSVSEEPITIPSSLMPICHASNSSCFEATNNCSGHGYCYKKYASKDEAAASDCYACKCRETRVTRKDGSVQTVRWGGSACQKKDVSSPFFLLAGISIMVVTAVIIAVGMLFGIGQEELPSVIGAGVGAPKAQK